MAKELPEKTDEMGGVLKDWKETHGNGFTEVFGDVVADERDPLNLVSSSFDGSSDYDEYH